MEKREFLKMEICKSCTKENSCKPDVKSMYQLLYDRTGTICFYHRLKPATPPPMVFKVAARGCGKVLYAKQVIDEIRKNYPDQKILIVRKKEIKK